MPDNISSSNKDDIVCKYCGSDILDIEHAIVMGIMENGRWYNFVFCCEQHGNYYQMGCEG